MTTPRVSIIIPVYNVTIYLHEALASVQAQDWPEKEIIVVDDGSDVQAAQEIAAICNDDPQIQLLRQENKGQAMARHYGVQWATGEFVVFLDADDTLLPGALRHLVKAFEGHPDAIATYGRKVMVDEKGNFIAQHILPLNKQIVSGDVLPALLKGVPLLSNGNCCIRRHALQKIQFPEHMRQGEDWVIWCRLALLGDVISAGERIVLCIRSHEKNVSADAYQSFENMTSMLDVVFQDTNFLRHTEAMPLAFYHQQHLQAIHAHLAYEYRRHGYRLKSLKHGLQRWRMPPLLPSRKIRVVHVVKWFYAGGAERLLTGILRYSNTTQVEHIVISLSDEKERLAQVESLLGVPYKAFHMPRGRWNIMTFLRCLLFMRSLRPHVVCTWLPPANVKGGLMAKLLGVPVVWGIHDAQDPATQPRITRWQTRLGRWVPRRVICCSQPVYEVCRQVGYDSAKLIVISNGVDVEAFAPRPEAGAALRRELGISSNTVLIGMAAEYTSVKRHEYFLKAARAFLVAHPDTAFLLCGKDTDLKNARLKKLLGALDLTTKVHTLGIRNDMAAIYSALDIHTLVSGSESFGLAVAEAMACETLNVATQVGMLPDLLRGVGNVIPVTDDAAVLADAWEHTLQLPGQEQAERRKEGRRRITSNYAIARTAHHYDALYKEVIGSENNAVQK